MSDKKYETYTLNHKPELVISGLLGKLPPKTRMVKTQKGDGIKTEFSIRVDLDKVNGAYPKEAVYLNVSVFGDYVAQLTALQSKQWPRIAVGGYLRATEEKAKPDGGFWPARLDFNAQRIYFGVEEGQVATVGNDASEAVSKW